MTKVGIIGRNGTGKTTLIIKVLFRITGPEKENLIKSKDSDPNDFKIIC